MSILHLFKAVIIFIILLLLSNSEFILNNLWEINIDYWKRKWKLLFDFLVCSKQSFNVYWRIILLYPSFGVILFGFNFGKSFLHFFSEFLEVLDLWDVLTKYVVSVILVHVLSYDSNAVLETSNCLLVCYFLLCFALLFIVVLVKSYPKLT